MKKILITGAGSYIGTSFEEYMKQWPDKYQVDTLDMIGDGWMKYDFSGYDCVYHVAGIAHSDNGKISREKAKLYYEVNTKLTIRTAMKAKKAGVKQFIFMSSAIVYGDSAPIGKMKMITKNTPVKPANCYGDSKVKAENGLKKLEDENFKVVILRPPMIYGKGSKGNYPLLSKLAQKVPVFPKVDNCRSMLYIENLMEFVRLMIENEERGTFWPQNAEYSNTSELVRMIAEQHGKHITLLKGFTIPLKIVGVTTNLVDKAFGNLAYDKKISNYTEEYRINTLKESIRKTEKIKDPTFTLKNKNEELVSVIIPAYNCADLIGDTIESVLNQTYKNLEIIIVDDCSTDNTINVIRRYCKMDSRIKLICQEENSGVCAARNKAIDNAKGKYIAFIDADDLWMPKKLELQIPFMETNSYGFTYTAYETFKNGSLKKGSVFSVPKSINYKRYLRNTIIGNLTVVINREMIPEFRVQKGMLEDVVTWMFYLKKGYVAYGLNINLAKYRVYASSRSGNKIRNAERYYRCLRDTQGLSFIKSLIIEFLYLYNASKKRIVGKIKNVFIM